MAAVQRVLFGAGQGGVGVRKYHVVLGVVVAEDVDGPEDAGR